MPILHAQWQCQFCLVVTIVYESELHEVGVILELLECTF